MKPEAPKETRAAVIVISREMLRHLLMLPNDMTVGAVHYDWERDAMGVRLDSEKFPVAEEGKMLLRLHPLLERKTLETGEVTIRIKRLEGEDGVDYVA